MGELNEFICGRVHPHNLTAMPSLNLYGDTLDSHQQRLTLLQQTFRSISGVNYSFSELKCLKCRTLNFLWNMLYGNDTGDCNISTETY